MQTPTRTPTPRAGSQTCDPNSPSLCASGFCTNNVCCDENTCLDPNRCDIFDSEGVCAPPSLESDECKKNTDCENPLVCALNLVSDRFECTATPPAPTRSPLPTSTSTPLPTSTPTPRIVRIDIGSGGARPGETVDIAISLQTSGASVAATGNDIIFDPGALSLDPSACRVNPTIGKVLVASLVSSGEVRSFIQSSQKHRTEDGPIYTCTLRISPLTLPGNYSLRNGAWLAFDPGGAQLPYTVGGDGLVTVSLLPIATPTSTAPPTATPTPTPTPMPCTGDCSGTQTVAINDLISLVNIALGNAGASACAHGIPNGASVDVSFIVRALNNALNGCP